MQLLRLKASTESRQDEQRTRALLRKQELLQLLQETPANAPTSRDLTASLLGVVQDLERVCPTSDPEVLTKLGGTWELLWTTQDRSSPQFNNGNPLRTWIK